MSERKRWERHYFTNSINVARTYPDEYESNREVLELATEGLTLYDELMEALTALAEACAERERLLAENTGLAAEIVVLNREMARVRQNRDSWYESYRRSIGMTHGTEIEQQGWAHLKVHRQALAITKLLRQNKYLKQCLRGRTLPEAAAAPTPEEG